MINDDERYKCLVSTRYISRSEQINIPSSTLTGRPKVFVDIQTKIFAQWLLWKASAQVMFALSMYQCDGKYGTSGLKWITSLTTLGSYNYYKWRSKWNSTRPHTQLWVNSTVPLSLPGGILHHLSITVLFSLSSTFSFMEGFICSTQGNYLALNRQSLHFMWLVKTKNRDVKEEKSVSVRMPRTLKTRR